MKQKKMKKKIKREYQSGISYYKHTENCNK